MAVACVLHGAAYVLLFSAIFAMCVARDEYCEKYNDCLEQVESKRSFCVQLMNERKANQSHTKQSLTSDVEECKIEHRRDMDAFKGLVLRKTEEYRNCLRSRMSSAPAILDATKQQKCDSLVSTLASFDSDDKTDTAKFSKLPVTMVRKNRRKKGRLNRKQQRKRLRMERRKNNPVRLCFAEAKKVKKRCMKISNCCTIADDCQLVYETSALHDQIETAKHVARQSRRKCKEASMMAKAKKKQQLTEKKTDNGGFKVPMKADEFNS